MLRKNNFVKISAILFLIFCVQIFSFAQKIPAEQNALAKFEKSIEQGNYADVERDLLNYAIQNPNDARAFELLAKIRFNQNRLSEARSLYQKTLKLDPNLTSAKINLAIVNFQTGNSAQSLSVLNEISDAEISNDTLRLNLAKAFSLVGDCGKALTTAEKLSLKIKNGDALSLRAECYFKSNEKQKIASLIPAAKNLTKQNPAAAIKFAGVLIEAAMYKEATEILRSVIVAAPQNAGALVLLSRSEIYLKDFANAKIHLAQAGKINANSAELFFAQSLFESEQGNAAQALVLLEKSLAENSDSTEILSQFVIVAMRANQAGKAVRAAEKLLEINSSEPEFLYLHGAASLQNNNTEAAENSLEKFNKFRPKDSRGCLALGLTYAAQPAKLDAARRQLEKCIETNPNNSEAKYQLALSYKTQGETANAIKYLEEAVKLSPGYAPALRDLGAVYLQTGAEAKAKIVLEKSVAINPNDGDTHFQLSRLYNLTGEKELAKKHLDIFQKLRTPTKNGM